MKIKKKANIKLFGEMGEALIHKIYKHIESYPEQFQNEDDLEAFLTRLINNVEGFLNEEAAYNDSFGKE